MSTAIKPIRLFAVVLVTAILVGTTPVSVNFTKDWSASFFELPRAVQNDPQLTLKPNEAGTYQEWSLADTTHWQATSDQSDSTYVYVTGSTILKETLNLENITQTGTINSVTAYIRAKAENSSYALTSSPSSTTGSWTNPTGAYADGGDYASTSTDSASQIFSGYGFNIPSESTIASVRVRYDAWAVLTGGITFVGAGAKAAGTGTVTPALPSGIQAGDILLLFAESNSGQAVTITNSNGGTWTELPVSPQDSTGSRLTVFWSRYNGTQGSPTTNDPGDHICAAIAAWRGVAPEGDPWDVLSGGTDNASSRSVSITGATTAVPNCLVVIVCSTGADSNTSQFSGWANSDLSNLTERVDYCTNQGGGGGFGVAEGLKTAAGSYGATTATLATASTKGFITIALKPNTTMPKIRVDVSWDGGSSWSAFQETELTTGETTYWYDITNVTSWTPEKLSDTNFRVRVTAVTAGTASQVVLDWIPVEVTYYVTPKVRVLWRTHETDYESSDILLSSSFADYSEMRTTNPNTGQAWTWEEVNSLQVGARASALAGDDNIKVSEIWIVVDYTASAAVIEIEVSGWPLWSNLQKGAENVIADADNGNPLTVTIKDTTNVTVSVRMKGSEALVAGPYSIGIENVVVDNTTTLSGAPFTLTSTFQVVPWMSNIPPPAADENLHAYFFISTRPDQPAGTYEGTLYVEAVQSGG